MSKKVLENIAKKYKNVQKGVNEIMGGRVLEHEGKTIFNEGRNAGIVIGEKRGKAEGRSEAFNTAIDFMRSNGMTAEQINSFRNLISNN